MSSKTKQDKIALYKPQTTLLINSVENDNKAALSKIEASLSIDKAMHGTLINNLSRMNPARAESLIVALLIRFNNSFNLPTEKKLNASQMYDLALDLLEVFGYETIEDLSLMLKMVRQGKIGDTIYKIDANTVLTKWVPVYLEKKAAAREQQHIYQKQAIDKKDPIILEAVQEAYKIYSKKHYVDTITAHMDRQMLEDTITHYAGDDELKIYVPLLKRKRKIIKK